MKPSSNGPKLAKNDHEAYLPKNYAYLPKMGRTYLKWIHTCLKWAKAWAGPGRGPGHGAWIQALAVTTYEKYTPC